MKIGLVILVWCAAFSVGSSRWQTTRSLSASTDPRRSPGVGNGYLRDLCPDTASQSRIFNGHCLAVVQSVDGQPGTVTLTATAPGLPKATAALQTTPGK